MSTRRGAEPPTTAKSARGANPKAPARPKRAGAAAPVVPAAPARDVDPGAASQPTAHAAGGSLAESPSENDDVPGDGAAVQLCFVRHSDAGDPNTWPGDDATRPLSAKGRRQAKRLAGLLSEIGWRPHVMLTSPKLRATQTAKILGRALGAKATEDERLGGPFGLQLIGDLLLEQGDARRVLLVGHDPEFSAIASELIGAAIEVRKGALVRMDLPDRSPRPGAASLRWLLPPGVIAG